MTMLFPLFKLLHSTSTDCRNATEYHLGLTRQCFTNISSVVLQSKHGVG